MTTPQRAGLGTDELDLIGNIEDEVHVLEDAPHHGQAVPVPRAPWDEGALVGLAPWAERMQLPGVDT